MPIERSEWIWYSGEWVRWEEATVHVTAHALHYGTSAFEGIRAYATGEGPAIFRLDRHIRRLLDSCKMLRFEMGEYDLELFSQLCVDLVSRNRHESCYIRPLVFRGVEVPEQNFIGQSQRPPEPASDGLERALHLPVGTRHHLRAGFYGDHLSCS